jgi:hypothetical protein
VQGSHINAYNEAKAQNERRELRKRGHNTKKLHVRRLQALRMTVSISPSYRLLVIRFKLRSLSLFRRPSFVAELRRVVYFVFAQLIVYG